MTVYRIALALRYTRISCRPFGARLELDRLVGAESEQDAIRQACLCLDAELEHVLAGINAINVSEFPVDILAVEIVAGDAGVLWNPSPHPVEKAIPPHLIVRQAAAHRPVTV